MTGWAREFYASFANRAVDLLRELREDTAFSHTRGVDQEVADAAREAAGALQRLLTSLWDANLLAVKVWDPFEEKDTSWEKMECSPTS